MPVARIVGRCAAVEIAVVERSAALESTVRAVSEHKVILELCICDRVLRTVVVEDSILPESEYGWDRSCCRSSCLGAP